MLKHLKRVFVQFRPGDPLSVSARELLQRASTDSARRSNPACIVEFKIDEESEEGTAFAELLFSDNDTRKIQLASVGVEEIARMIERKASEMEMIAVLKEVGCHALLVLTSVSQVIHTASSSKLIS
jgi:large subunit ribosomal protein L53